MDELSPTQRLAETLMTAKGTTLRDFILERADLDVPAPAIARQLRDATDGQVDVSGQAIRNWVRQFRAGKEEAAAEVAS